ncbi:MAG TPA: hypothetical protein VI216_09380 [Candidatus Acidoferrales bacterium]
MRKPKQVRYLILPIALLALLLVGMTTGSVWHHHTGSSESTCPICHLSHQPIDRPVPTDPAPAFALTAPTAEPKPLDLAPNPVISRVPARAPPIS